MIGPTNVTAADQSNISLTCKIYDEEKVTVEWRKGNIPLNLTTSKYQLDKNNNTLTIRNVSAVDNGEYTCAIKNGSVTLEQSLQAPVYIHCM